MGLIQQWIWQKIASGNWGQTSRFYSVWTTERKLIEAMNKASETCEIIT